MQQEELPEQMQDSSAPEPAGSAEPEGERPFRIKWSWWWLFPGLLLAWLASSAIPHNTATADSLLSQSLAAAQAGRYQDCITAAQRAIQLKPALPEAYNNIGWCSANLGNWDEGISNLRKALEIKPDMELARQNLLWVVQQKSRAGAPVQAPATPADAALLTSLHHAEAHRYQECLDAARQAIQLNPNSAEAYNNLGYCYGGLGKWDEGLQSLREALRLRPDFPLASGNLSWISAEKAKAAKRARPN